MFSFNLPLINRPILWYGVLFALGFFLGYLLFHSLLKKELLPKGIEKKKIAKLAEKLATFIMIGTLLGARLGEILFYQNWHYYLSHPLSLFKVWEGGLASHGGAVGILGALFFYTLYLKRNNIPLKFLRLLDLVVIPTAIAGAFIRVGNFINQEIIGKVTDLPWAVVFGHPADGSPALPRHPVQLYEALAYLVTAGILFYFYRLEISRRRGFLSGLFLLHLFAWRFIIEFFKVKQSYWISSDSSWLMGQLLSLPFVILGFYFLKRSLSPSKKKV